MSRMVRIKSCADCPHLVWVPIPVLVPHCGYGKIKKRRLGYTKPEGYETYKTIAYDGVIPDWCRLEKIEAGGHLK
jgi:hypothetical protein